MGNRASQPSLIQQHEEQRPKNAGVHSDQNKRHHTKSARRAAKQKGYDRDE